jgi:hypothetical protein
MQTDFLMVGVMSELSLPLAKQMTTILYLI